LSDLDLSWRVEQACFNTWPALLRPRQIRRARSRRPTQRLPTTRPALVAGGRRS